MSRTYSKILSFTDNRKGARLAKRHANKTVRKMCDIPNGNQYKKAFCSWNIHDYRSNTYHDRDVYRLMKRFPDSRGFKNRLRKKKSLLQKNLFTRETIRR